MIQGMGIVIGGIWRILSINIPIDGYNLKLWYVPAFIILLVTVLKIMLGGNSNGE